jgi:hypothetical protein
MKKESELMKEFWKECFKREYEGKNLFLSRLPKKPTKWQKFVGYIKKLMGLK